MSEEEPIFDEEYWERARSRGKGILERAELILENALLETSDEEDKEQPE